MHHSSSKYSSLDKIATAFSSAANTYDLHSHMQRETATRAALLLKKMVEKNYWEIGVNIGGVELKKAMPKVDKLLMMDVGCATGYATTLMAKALPYSCWLACDIATKMVQYATKHNEKSNVLYRKANFLDDEEMCRAVDAFTNKTENYRKGKQIFNGITALATIHWALPIQKSIEKLSTYLRPKGIFVFSVYLQECYKEMKEAGIGILREQNLPSYQDVVTCLHRCGFSLTYGEEHFRYLYFKNWESFRAYQRLQGTTTSNVVGFSKRKEIFKKLQNAEASLIGRKSATNSGLKNTSNEEVQLPLRITSHFGLYFAQKK